MIHDENSTDEAGEAADLRVRYPSGSIENQDSPSPLISVIIPVYNDAARLALCLSRLRAQTFDPRNFEVLVVDNGSRDSPEHVVAEFPFAMLVSQRHPGSYAARNLGVTHARGQILAFTDSDCAPTPTWLAAAFEWMSTGPEVDAIGGRVDLMLSPRPTSAELFERATAFQQERHVIEERFAVTANLIVRREIFERVGPFDSELKSNGDIEWGKRMASMGFNLAYAANVVVEHPPRKSLAELVKRRRRLEGGKYMRRTRHGVQHQAVAQRTVGRRGISKAIAMSLSPGRYGFTRSQVMRVLAVAVLLEMTGVWEKIRLYLGGEPTRA